MVMSTELEVRLSGHWKKMNVVDALAEGISNGRCIYPQCHKPVRANAQGKNGNAAFVRHERRNKKCPFSDTKDSRRLLIDYLSAFPKSGQDYLVLWKYSEALRVNGLVMTGAEGTHAGGLARGDRVFVVATRSDELYLLGAMEVQRSGEREAVGKSLFGAFHIIPLKGLKWQLRFEATQSPKLTKDKSVAWQVRSRRLLSEGSAKLLGDVLLKTQLAQDAVEVQEGKTTKVTLTKRERSRELRVFALANRGTVCEICGFDFVEAYGEFARNCVEVHHLEQLAGAGRDGVTTSLDDVRVVCPNCHRALHQFRDPGDLKAFRKACRLR
jgi:hypothetical protein